MIDIKISHNNQIAFVSKDKSTLTIYTRFSYGKNHILPPIPNFFSYDENGRCAITSVENLDDIEITKIFNHFLKLYEN